MSEENNHPPIILYFFMPALLIVCGCQLVHKCITNRQRVVPSRQILLNETENIEITNVLHTNNLMIELEKNSILTNMDTITNNNDECIICTELLSEKQIRILKCTHKFHQDCIDSWLSVCQKLECPICGMSLNEQDENAV